MKFIVGILLLVFAISQANAQTVGADSNNLQFGFEKILNTYVFRFVGIYSNESELGNIKIRQNYTGTSISTIKDYFRDDQNLALSYRYPFFQWLSAGSDVKYLLNSDSKSNGLNETERINGVFTFDNSLWDNSLNQSVSFGLEDNTIAGFNSLGTLFSYDLALNELNLDDYLLNSKFNYMNLNLDKDRNYLDMTVFAVVNKRFGLSDALSFIFNYKKQGRDYIQTMYANEQKPIEKRLEEKFGIALNLNFSIVDDLMFDISANFENTGIRRSFNQAVADNKYSYLVRSLDQNNFGFDISGVYNLGLFKQNMIISFQNRNEVNRLSNKFQLLEVEFDRFESQEKQRDNVVSVTRVFSSSIFEVSKSGNFILNLSASMNRFDSPSTENNDDRDELSTLVSLSYQHIFSEYFSYKVTSELLQNHLVFIKAQRSSLNNWNRVLKLTQEMMYQIGKSRFNPRIELLANYTVYDFETESSGSRSYSFRQLSISDSILLNLSKSGTIESRIYSRYFERGILYWNEFAETPQTANFEMFANALYFHSFNIGLRAGLGMRYYKLKQNNISGSGLPASLNYHNQDNFGPEFNFFFQLSNNSNVIFKGWYDFRNYNEKVQVPLVNVILQTNITI